MLEEAQAADLLVLGVRRPAGRTTVFGEFALRVAREAACPLILIRHGAAVAQWSSARER